MGPDRIEPPGPFAIRFPEFQTDSRCAPPSSAL